MLWQFTIILFLSSYIHALCVLCIRTRWYEGVLIISIRNICQHVDHDQTSIHHSNDFSNFCFNDLWCCKTRPATNDIAILVDKEFLKVPLSMTSVVDLSQNMKPNLDSSEPEETSSLRFEPFEDLVSRVAVNVRLLHQWECHPIVGGTETCDGSIVTGLLACKLIAREAKDFQTFILVFVIKTLKS